mgnify:CR=1 FL=1
MYPNRAEILSASAKKFSIYAIILAAFGAFVFFIFFLPSKFLYNLREDFYFLIFPTAAILVGTFIKSFVNAYFVGRWSELIASFILYLANGTSAVLFLAFASRNMRYLTAIAWVALLAISIIICKASKYFYTEIYAGCLIKAFSYILMGFSIKSMFSDRILRSFSNQIMISFVILALLQIATLIELLYTEKSRRLSMWLKNNHFVKYIGIFTSVFLIGVLRRDILSSGLEGWIFIFMVLLMIFIIFAARMWGSVKYSPEEKLAKHIQDMSFDKSKDLEKITKYIEDYVNFGKKSRLISYLTYLGYKSGIPVNAVSNIIAPIVEYSDPEIPGMLTSEQYKAIEERNRQNRSRVIEKITSNLKLFGKGVYVYNGYGTGTKNLQDYN